jgi:transcriptional regulator with XRE-family HTH domain
VDNDVGAFLRSRRARLEPQDAGLPARSGRSRLVGLRREDVAALANVSVDYYTRLEQGRAGAVSDGVLDAIGRALHLDTVQREHLGRLARPVQSAGRAAPHALSEEHRLLLDTLTAAPAIAIDSAMDVLDANALAAELFGMDRAGGETVNAARLAFAQGVTAGRIRNREAVAAASVAHLRYQSARVPEDGRIQALIAELSAASEEFRTLWARQDVRGASSIEISVEHPDVGSVELRNLWLASPLEPDVMLVVYLARDGSEAAEKLARLTERVAARAAGPDAF